MIRTLAGVLLGLLTWPVVALIGWASSQPGGDPDATIIPLGVVALSWLVPLIRRGNTAAIWPAAPIALVAALAVNTVWEAPRLLLFELPAAAAAWLSIRLLTKRTVGAGWKQWAIPAVLGVVQFVWVSAFAPGSGLTALLWMAVWYGAAIVWRIAAKNPEAPAPGA